MAKLNSFLDSNPKLKEFGGNRVELSIGAKEYKRSNHIACFASVSMPDGSDKCNAKYTLEYPGCTTNGFAGFPSEREILMRIAKGDCVTENEVKVIIDNFQALDDMLEKFSQQIESDKKRLIEEECAAELANRLSSEVPAMRKKLREYLSKS